MVKEVNFHEYPSAPDFGSGDHAGPCLVLQRHWVNFEKGSRLPQVECTHSRLHLTQFTGKPHMRLTEKHAHAMQNQIIPGMTELMPVPLIAHSAQLPYVPCQPAPRIVKKPICARLHGL
jgi:hypothetical protein